jgi:bisphosphoglycerate-independent phosphoglycerate mutase (AlkP superfamily)
MILSNEQHLRELCDKGIKEVESGRYDTIKFNLFNSDEVEFVRDYMAHSAPYIHFFTTRAV